MARCCGTGEPNSRRPSSGTSRRARNSRRRIILPPSGGVRRSIRSFRDLLARKDFLVVPAASVLPWNNDDGRRDADRRHQPRNADRLSRRHLHRLAGRLPGAHLADAETAGSEAVRRSDHCRPGGGVQIVRIRPADRRATGLLSSSGHPSDQASRCSRRAASELARPLDGFASGRRNVPALAFRSRSACRASTCFTAATT